MYAMLKEVRENSKSVCYFKQLLLIREEAYEPKVKMPPKSTHKARRNNGNESVC